MKMPKAKGEFSSENNGGSQGNDFSEYMWMENEEEFDEEVLKQLEEEALMEQCIEAMLEDELENSENMLSELELMELEDKIELAKKSTLNPEAAEFVSNFLEVKASALIEGSVKENSAGVEDNINIKNEPTKNGTGFSKSCTKDNYLMKYENDTVKKENGPAFDENCSLISGKKS